MLHVTCLPDFSCYREAALINELPQNILNPKNLLFELQKSEAEQYPKAAFYGSKKRLICCIALDEQSLIILGLLLFRPN